MTFKTTKHCKSHCTEKTKLFGQPNTCDPTSSTNSCQSGAFTGSVVRPPFSHVVIFFRVRFLTVSYSSGLQVC